MTQRLVRQQHGWQIEPDRLTGDDALLYVIDNTVQVSVKHLDEAADRTIQLQFPAFGDGRAYSQALLLRRLGYSGALHAAGTAVCIDQLPQLLSVGFDGLLPDPGRNLNDLLLRLNHQKTYWPHPGLPSTEQNVHIIGAARDS